VNIFCADLSCVQRSTECLKSEGNAHKWPSWICAELSRILRRGSVVEIRVFRLVTADNGRAGCGTGLIWINDTHLIDNGIYKTVFAHLKLFVSRLHDQFTVVGTVLDSSFPRRCGHIQREK